MGINNSTLGKSKLEGVELKQPVEYLHFVEGKGLFALIPSHPTERRNTWFFFEKKKWKNMSLKKNNIYKYIIYIYINIWSDVNQKKYKRNSKIIPKKNWTKNHHSPQQVKMATATYLAIPLGQSRYFIKVLHQL